MVILYHHPYSQHSRRVRALLEEANIEHELRQVALDAAEHHTPAFLAINPNHQVPVLVDGSFKLAESHAILRYLCAKHALTDWYPNDLAQRARVDEWLDWNHCRLSRHVVDIVLNKMFLGERGDQAAIMRGAAALPELMQILDQGLAGRAFLCGARPTIADLSVASNLTQLGLAGHQPEQQAVRAWYARVHEIPGFARTLPPSPASGR